MTWEQNQKQQDDSKQSIGHFDFIFFHEMADLKRLVHGLPRSPTEDRGLVEHLTII